MNKLLFFLGVILTLNFQLITFNSLAQAPNWLWAKSASGIGTDEAYSIKVDASGNTYITGCFSSNTITFGTTTLTRTGWKDMFLAKYDSNGNVLWARRAGGTMYDVSALSISIDANGNAYVVGIFGSPTITFGSITLTNAGTGSSWDVFLVVYNSNGNVLWATRAGGTNFDFAQSVTLDDLGNIYIVGGFYSSTITFGSTTLTNVGNCDIFITKYEEDGNLLWAKGIGGSNWEGAGAVSVDASGCVYLNGDFESHIITFDSISLTNVGNTGNIYDIFFVKYDPNGNIIWAKSIGGINDDVTNSVAIDGSGNLYIEGVFGSPILTIGNNTLTNNNDSTTDFFLAKYDSTGNVLWAKSIGGIKDEYAISVAVDIHGYAYITGYYGSPTVTFDTTTLTNNNDSTTDIFLAKYDSTGNVLWAKSTGGIADDVVYSLALDTSDNFYITGYFKSPVISFDSTILSNAGIENIFLAKSNCSTVLKINEWNNSSNISVYPNPAKNYFKIECSQKSIIEIFNMQGQILKVFLSNSNIEIVDISTWLSGLYVIKVKNEKGICINKFVKE